MNGTPESDASASWPILHDYWRSSAAYRIRIALNLKGIAYRAVPVNLVAGDQRAADYLARNPQGLVPALEMDGQLFTQSLAIVDYLDARAPDPPFVPKDPVARSHVLAMALAIACDIHPINNLRILRRLKAAGLDDAARDAWYRETLVDGLAALETLAGRHAATYLSGDAPGIADLTLVPQLYNARRFAVPLDAYPTLLAIDARLTALDPVARAHPDRQPDAPGTPR